MMAWIITASMSFMGCQDDDNLPSNSNQNTNPSDTTSSEYPFTAQVIHNAVTDIDGNSYDAVQIGDQIWMASNLRTTREPSGEFIPESTITDTVPLRYKPNTDIISYGYLYNNYATMNGDSYSSSNPSGVQGICPNGWHLPSAVEWQQLGAYVLSFHLGMNVCVFCAQNAWENGCYGYSDCNVTGFSAYPAGCFDSDDHGAGTYEGFGGRAYFWTSSMNKAFFSLDDIFSFNYDKGILWRGYDGYSVRCIKN